MNLADAMIAIEALKDRVCMLETDEHSPVEQSRELLNNCRKMYNELRSIHTHILRCEKRMENKLLLIDDITKEFKKIIKDWADYFDNSRLNFRKDMDVQLTKVAEELNDIKDWKEVQPWEEGDIDESKNGK